MCGVIRPLHRVGTGSAGGALHSEDSVCSAPGLLGPWEGVLSVPAPGHATCSPEVGVMSAPLTGRGRALHGFTETQQELQTPAKRPKPRALSLNRPPAARGGQAESTHMVCTQQRHTLETPWLLCDGQITARHHLGLARIPLPRMFTAKVQSSKRDPSGKLE